MTSLTREQRTQIATRMRGNTNARGKVMRRFAYRPSINIGSKRAATEIAAGNFMLDLDWHSGGRAGISTNDSERAAAWVTKAKSLGYMVRDAAPKPVAATISQMVNEELCPGHVASDADPQVCGRCGVHIESLKEPWE